LPWPARSHSQGGDHSFPQFASPTRVESRPQITAPTKWPDVLDHRILSGHEQRAQECGRCYRSRHDDCARDHGLALPPDHESAPPNFTTYDESGSIAPVIFRLGGRRSLFGQKNVNALTVPMSMPLALTYTSASFSSTMREHGLPKTASRVRHHTGASMSWVTSLASETSARLQK